MRKSSIKILICFFNIITTGITYMNSFQSWDNDTLEESSASSNISLENGNSSMQDNECNLNNTYETVVVRVASAIDIYFTPFLIVLGISGNLLSVYVFFASKLRHQSTSQYLSALAISDSLFLAQLIPPWLSTIEINGLFQRDAYCKGFVYVSYVTCCLSSWLVIAFTVERFVAVYYPLQQPAICTVKRARYIILALTVGAMLINLPVIHFAGSGNQECHIDREKMEQAAKFNWVDTTVTFTVPFSLIVALNTWIATQLYKLERERSKLTQEELRAASSRDSDLMYAHSQRRITNMLLIVSTIYVIFNCPAYTLRVCGYVYDMDSPDLDPKWLTAQNIATMLFNMNFGINFFLYCVSGQNFRRALAETVPCFRWLRPKTRVRKISTTKRGRTCSVTTTVGSHGTDARVMETSFGRPTTWWRRQRSCNYILRWSFDNSRQRGAAALGEAPESISMREITSQPGPSRIFRDEQPQPGPSNVFSIEQERPVTDRRSAVDLRRPVIASRGSAIDPRRSAIRSRRPVTERAHVNVDPERPDIHTQPRRPVVPEVIIVKKRKSSALWRFRQLFHRSRTQTREEKAQLYD